MFRFARFITDDRFNIPDQFDAEFRIVGKGNGIPDILDEAEWGAPFWEYMQKPSGEIHWGTETERYSPFTTYDRETKLGSPLIAARTTVHRQPAVHPMDRVHDLSKPLLPGRGLSRAGPRRQMGREPRSVRQTRSPDAAALMACCRSSSMIWNFSARARRSLDPAHHRWLCCPAMRRNATVPEGSVAAGWCALGTMGGSGTCGACGRCRGCRSRAVSNVEPWTRRPIRAHGDGQMQAIVKFRGALLPHPIQGSTGRVFGVGES
jgi:hypothetical protein